MSQSYLKVGKDEWIEAPTPLVQVIEDARAMEDKYLAPDARAVLRLFIRFAEETCRLGAEKEKAPE